MFPYTFQLELYRPLTGSYLTVHVDSYSEKLAILHCQEVFQGWEVMDWMLYC